MLAGMGLCHSQSDFANAEYGRSALRSLCVENGIDSTTIFFCKQERILESIRDHYCQVSLYNDLGFLIEPLIKDKLVELAQLEFVFKNLHKIKPQHCDSSKSIELEKENWVIGKDFSLQNSFVIVCYWSVRKHIQEQLLRMHELIKIKSRFADIPIRLVFVNQDFIP